MTAYLADMFLISCSCKAAVQHASKDKSPRLKMANNASLAYKAFIASNAPDVSNVSQCITS